MYNFYNTPISYEFDDIYVVSENRYSYSIKIFFKLKPARLDMMLKQFHHQELGEIAKKSTLYKRKTKKIDLYE